MTAPAWRCVRCDRPLFSPAALLIKPNGHTLRWGPVCAIKAGLIDPPKRRAAPGLAAIHRRRAAAHESAQPGQLDIFGATAS